MGIMLGEGTRRLRLEDVAKLANVSVSTVSRVVNGVDTVNASTRKRVLKVLEKSNYHPNLQARSLVVGRSSTIGIIVSNLLNPFFVDVFHAIEGDARANGFEVLVGNTNYDADQLSANIRMMIGRRVAGIALVISEALPPALSELVGVGIPIAIYDVGTQGKGIANIRFDNRKGMTQIVEYLYSMGHRRMAYIGLSSALLPTDVRRSAFLEIAARNSVETRDFKISFQEGLEGARAAVRDIVKSGFDPTAIICVNDMIAIGALRELRDHGIDVPGHVSVTGFDNIEFSEFTCAIPDYHPNPQGQGRSQNVRGDSCRREEPDQCWGRVHVQPRTRSTRVYRRGSGFERFPSHSVQGLVCRDQTIRSPRSPPFCFHKRYTVLAGLR